MNRLTIILLLVFCPFSYLQSQNKGHFSGSFQSTSHYYVNDRILSTIAPDNPWASNNYMQLNYNWGPITAGLQYEAYMPPLSGFPYQLEGNKITNRFIRITKGIIDITAGNFYEQFGNGLILRAFESRELGINNSLDGVRVILRPAKFLRITGIYGRQRKFMDVGNNYIRGIDADILIDSLLNTSLNLKLGAGIVSRHEKYTGTLSDFPSTVNASSIRLSLNNENLEINSEYVYKSDDPTLTNQYSNKCGSSFLLNGSWFKEGLGMFMSLRFLDNMDFRSERESEGLYSMVNYLPANTRQHSYMLTNIYPYSTQSAGETSFQGEINYTFSGTGIRFNYSHAGENIMTSSGRDLYFQDINLEISKKWDTRFKTIITYVNLMYDKKLLEAPVYDFVKSNIVIADLRYRISSVLSLRGELQHLWTKQDHGNWAAALAEIGYAPHWSLFVSDMTDYQWNQNVHYMNFGLGYSSNFARISFGYGRQREGLICVGGICQRVPSYKGFNLKLNVNF
ncbi:MAG: hypothetical protein A2X18_01190 [Bacteroidetes bacterium GWF2_40_14]|nr:MAG: hypothetical protein A2X18_01190 [Bacteroidetes bacterium GWF2_40_14]